MRRTAQFHINVLHSAYEGWRNRTRQIFTRRQELLSKYTADFAGKSCTVGLIEAFDKTLLNIARIRRLDKRRIRSNYCFMFQTLQNVTVIHEYIAECDLWRTSKFFRLSQQFVSGKHFESDRALHLATQVIAQWSRYTQNKIKTTCSCYLETTQDSFRQMVEAILFEAQRTSSEDVGWQTYDAWTIFFVGVWVLRYEVWHSTCQTGISLSTTELSTLCKDNVRTLGALYEHGRNRRELNLGGSWLRAP